MFDNCRTMSYINRGFNKGINMKYDKDNYDYLMALMKISPLFKLS